MGTSKHRESESILEAMCQEGKNPRLPSHACIACAYMLKSMGFVAFTCTDQSYITAHLSISIRIYTIPTPGNQLLQTELIKRTEKRTPSLSHMFAQACSHSVEYSRLSLILLINLHFYFCSVCRYSLLFEYKDPGHLIMEHPETLLL